MSEMREKFEKRFPAPYGVYWDNDCLQYEPEAPEYEPDADIYHRQFVVWQAATERAGRTISAEQLAQKFHDAYERMAPEYGYETRSDTKSFDPESKNGRLMIAVCSELMAYTSPPAPAVPQGKYDEVLTPFVRLMEKELHANASKGDRPGWLSMSPDQVMLEIYYHASKLQKTLRDDDLAGVTEHSADVANMAMMALDVCGGFNAAQQPEDDDQ